MNIVVEVRNREMKIVAKGSIKIFTIPEISKASPSEDFTVITRKQGKEHILFVPQ